MNAYFVTCTGFEADDDGTVRVVHCTYDPATKGGNAPDGRKVKGTIQLGRGFSGRTGYRPPLREHCR